jgi:hypothetical protein
MDSAPHLTDRLLPWIPATFRSASWESMGDTQIRFLSGGETFVLPWLMNRFDTTTTRKQVTSEVWVLIQK